MTFCREFLDCFYVMGIVPVVYVFKDDIREYVPCVFKATLGAIYHIGLDQQKFDKTHEMEWNVIKMKTKKDKKSHRKYKKVKVISGLGYDPDECGNLRSIVSSLIPAYMFMTTLESRILRNEAFQTIVLEKPQQRDAQRTTAERVFLYDVFSDANFQNVQEDYRFVSNPNEEFVLRQRRNELPHPIEISTIDENDGKNNPYKLLSIPPEHIAKTFPKPNDKPFLLNYKAYFKNIVLMAYNVPEGFISSSVNGIYHITNNHTSIMEDKFQVIKDIVSYVVTIFINDIYSTYSVETLRSMIIRDEEQEEISAENETTNNTDENLRIVLFIPRRDLDYEKKISELYHLGIIPLDVFKHFVFSVHFSGLMASSLSQRISYKDLLSRAQQQKDEKREDEPDAKRQKTKSSKQLTEKGDFDSAMRKEFQKTEKKESRQKQVS